MITQREVGNDPHATHVLDMNYCKCVHADVHCERLSTLMQRSASACLLYDWEEKQLHVLINQGMKLAC